MTIHPTKLGLEGNTLVIDWSDGQRRRYDVADLRRGCPCATCGSARAESRPLFDESEFPPSKLAIRQMAPVGNYAYTIHFSDGHDTGIYTLDHLRQLGETTNP